MQVRTFKSIGVAWAMSVLSIIFLIGCHLLPCGRHVGADATAPTITSTVPVNAATSVAINASITATFSEAMDPTTITTDAFTLTGPGGTPVIGTVAYDIESNTATFTPADNLAGGTLFTAAITTGIKDVAGNALEADFVWNFTSGLSLDTSAPTVNATIPADAATNVAANARIIALFSEVMNPATINAAHFTLTGPGAASVAGHVTYGAVGNAAIFAPDANLELNATYTATLTTGVEDLSRHALANNKVWTFTTAATPPSADTTAPTVTSTNPANAASGVAVDRKISATFSEAIDLLTINAASFKVTGPGVTSVAGTVAYDVASNIATLSPTANLAAGTTFTATITTAVKDQTGNALANNYVWTFSTGTMTGQPPVNLKSVSTFVVLAGSAVSNTGPTMLNGDLGVSPSATVNGFPPGTVHGSTHASDSIAAQAKLDLTAAFLDAQGRSTNSQTLPGNLGGLTFTPGLYTNSTSVMISGAGPSNNVTLDAQGDADAVFVFQMGSTLTTGPASQVILSGGAKASNVYWGVGTSATLDTTSVFKGNILAQTSITMNTGATLDGRALAQNGAVTLDSNTITKPAP